MNVPLLNSFIDLLIAHQAKNVKNGAFQNCWRTARGAIIKLSCMKSLNCTFSDFRNLPTIWIDLMQRISKEDAIQMSSFAFTKLSIKEKSNVSFQMVFKKKILLPSTETLSILLSKSRTLQQIVEQNVIVAKSPQQSTYINTENYKKNFPKKSA